MRRRKFARAPVLAAAFALGALAGGSLLWSYANSRMMPRGHDCGDPDADSQLAADAVDPEPRPEPVRRTARIPEELPRLVGDPVADLKGRRLTLPVRGVDGDDLQSSFDDARGGDRRHEAMDILAARHTPVLAVEDGVIARLFESKAGGLTIYQFDPGYNFAYYYAHLEKYADGLGGGDRVRRGQVIGYVGTSGNAPPNTPHLHFAIFKLTDKKQWWKGTAIDPFDVLR